MGNGDPIYVAAVAVLTSFCRYNYELLTKIQFVTMGARGEFENDSPIT
jgi:hypothetical protein